ncbi:hypothetical protein DL766_008218 [Monosporascus sp. MC13-8B]|uniref:Uncharacterized protein n=1 Tax=Monosporascus cannonballus TaxID=155416 RepID=A0ABY0GXX7_9PEZI|nr:hypothetical protein DL762_008211 [Monosporascus cannonballus]RYO81739.1 hypothetical protein DL763_008477 [Monosporascus cannonballus]RYP20359.1 hypothetical protein DL766_008218 [Monosporascus sp. MC13-8B]
MHRFFLGLSVVASLVLRVAPIPARSLHRLDSPALAGFNADPNIIVFGNTYYIYPTADGQDWEGKSFYVWKSQNLVDWTRSKDPILTLNGKSGPGNVPWADGKAWAPTIIERNGKYYFYHSGHSSADDSIAIGAAVADSPEGPFAAQPTPMIRNAERLTATVAIDPAVFRDPATGRHLLYWGNGRALHAELGDDMVSVDWDTLGEGAGLDDYFEAPFVVHRRGLYHMTWSIDDTRSEDYRVGYATAANATGPWASHGIILRKDPALGILGTGHQSIINVPGTDDWYIAYHRFAIPDGDGSHRVTAIDRLTFDPDTGLIQPVRPTLGNVEPQPIQH